MFPLLKSHENHHCLAPDGQPGSEGVLAELGQHQMGLTNGLCYTHGKRGSSTPTGEALHDCHQGHRGIAVVSRACSLAQDWVSADFFQYGSVLKSPFSKIITNVLYPFGV